MDIHTVLEKDLWTLGWQLSKILSLWGFCGFICIIQEENLMKSIICVFWDIIISQGLFTS